MATYSEIRQLFNNDELRNRVSVAIVKEANTILRSASPTDAQKTWARNALQNTDAVAAIALRAVLAQNSDATIEQIRGVTDEGIQTQVSAIVGNLVGA